MLLAIYEKQNNVAKAKILVKNYKKENEKSENNKTFNIIMQRIESKKKAIFDYEFYQNLLHWNKDAELEDKYDQEKRIEEENNLELTLQRQQEIENIRKKQEAINTRRDKGKGRENNGKATREIRRETNTNTLKKARQNFEKEIKVELNHIKQPRIKPERQINYFDGVMKYLKEKKHLIYAKMQSNNGEIQREGISQWDKMDRLIQKVQDNKDNKSYLSELYNKILLLQENGIER